MNAGQVVADGAPAEVLTTALFADVFAVQVEPHEVGDGQVWIVT